MKVLIRYLVTLPNDLLICWPAVLIIWAVTGTKLRWENGGLWCDIKEGSWAVNADAFLGGWYLHYKGTPFERSWGGTTLGHGGWYGPGRSGEEGLDTWVETHEGMHSHQSEVAMLGSLLLSVAGHLTGEHWAALVIWALGWLTTCAAGWIVAWLRELPVYRGSLHEQQAYDKVQLMKLLRLHPHSGQVTLHQDVEPSVDAKR